MGQQVETKMSDLSLNLLKQFGLSLNLKIPNYIKPRGSSLKLMIPNLKKTIWLTSEN